MRPRAKPAQVHTPVPPTTRFRPALRAKASSEVTPLFCRLPLATLSPKTRGSWPRRPDAVLGTDRSRGWSRSPGFSLGRLNLLPQHKRALPCRELQPSQFDRLDSTVVRPVSKKRELFPGVQPAVSRFAAWSPKNFPRVLGSECWPISLSPTRRAWNKSHAHAALQQKQGHRCRAA